MTVTCYRTLKTYSLGVDDQLRAKWGFYKGKWRKLTPNIPNEKWFEDYRYGIAMTKDMLECWLSYLPGVVEWNVYNDFTVVFDMDDVEEEGWSEQDLRGVLEDMARYVKMRRVIHGEEPWLTSRVDDYGTQHDYYQHSAIDPLDGMLNRDYPRYLEPTG